jgi:hypothetical protein
MSVTPNQAVAVAKALFPLVQGQYLECDQGFDHISQCPFDARLRQQIAVYAANYGKECPSGCGGALLLLRQQCGGFPHEQLSTPANPAIAIVMLTGNSCMGNGQTMYVSVVIESGQPLADDVYCNVGDPRYGMYNSDPTATSGLACAPG